MATCKITGRPLPVNLYNDARGAPNKYRYKRPDGTYKTISADYEHACQVADEANKLRDSSAHSSRSIAFWVEEYIKWMVGQDPTLQRKRGWRDRCASLRKFATETDTPIAKVDVSAISDWWDKLSYDQQHNRRSNYSQFFQWAMSKGVAKHNPFNTSDALPHLIKKKKPSKRRMPIQNMGEFQAIYACADDFLQVAMMISLTTTMRAGDVAALKFSDIVESPQGKKLCRTIAKSANQRGATAATHNGWLLSRHLKLAAAINAGRTLSLSRFGSPPFIVNKRPTSRRQRVDCTHISQVTSKDLSRAFKRAVTKCGLWDDIPDGRTPPTFHEVRGLAIDLLLKAGTDIREVQKLAAHTDEAITSGYTANHPPEYVDLGVVVNDEVLK